MDCQPRIETPTAEEYVELNRYKLIAIDIDGTLLTSEKSIAPETKKAIEKAIATGVHVVLCTGRPLSGVKDYLEALGLNAEGRYVATYNGALVQEIKSGEPVVHHQLKGSDMIALLELSQQLGLRSHFMDLDFMYTTDKEISDYTVLDAYLTKSRLNAISKNEVGVEQDYTKFMMVDHPELIDIAEKNLPDSLLEDYTVIRSQPFFLEIMKKGAHKGSGIESLAQKLGINASEVICIGDAENDRHMIEYAGLGVAMDNASDAIKSIANFVTKTNDEHGVAHVIEEYILA
ncbi:MAG: sugar-phosphatase [Turicibacter sp.]|nr:sugar-phosphatase [Turicibacter sp.]